MLIRIRKGTVTKVIKQRDGITYIKVDIEGKEEPAINYDYITGTIKAGDKVILNTTALELRLGSGGYHFVLANENIPFKDIKGKGHIMKLNYTPIQIKVCVSEEVDSGFQDKLKRFSTLDNMPIIIGSLHSIVLPVVATLCFLSDCKLNITYIMTDASCLPIYLSDSVYELKEKGMLKTTITVGNAFGGDFEAVNIYSALILCKEVVKSDIVVVAMGIGNIGTGTEYGFSAIEQGEIINAVNVLGGKPIAVPRISFADKRERHYGVSHHTLTNLGKVALSRAIIPIPKLTKERVCIIEEKFKKYSIYDKHKVIEVDGGIIFKALKKYNFKPTIMGRSVEEDREYFTTCGSAAKYAFAFLTQK